MTAATRQRILALAAALDEANENIDLDALLDSVTALLQKDGHGILQGAVVTRWYIAQVGMVNGLSPEECGQLAYVMVLEAAQIMAKDPTVTDVIEAAQKAGKI